MLDCWWFWKEKECSARFSERIAAAMEDAMMTLFSLKDLCAQQCAMERGVYVRKIQDDTKKESREMRSAQQDLLSVEQFGNECAYLLRLLSRFGGNQLDTKKHCQPREHEGAV